MSFEQVVGEKENRLEFLTSAPATLPRQVVTLAFLSKHLPSALMSAQSGRRLKDARADGEFWGRLTESAIGAHLANAAAAGACPP